MTPRKSLMRYACVFRRYTVRARTIFVTPRRIARTRSRILRRAATCCWLSARATVPIQIVCASLPRAALRPGPVELDAALRRALQCARLARGDDPACGHPARVARTAGAVGGTLRPAVRVRRAGPGLRVPRPARARTTGRRAAADRKSVGAGKAVAGRLESGGGR